MENIDEILIRHFSGEATPVEEASLLNWRKENEQEYAVLKKAWLESDFSINKEFNTVRAWKKVQKETTRTKILPLVGSIKIKYGIAASVILILSILGAIYFAKPDSSDSLAFENKFDTALEIVLPDSSHVWLNKGARLTYNQDQKEKRTLHLNGEAFFEVKRDTQRPFVISTEQTLVTVLGTSFNLNATDSNCLISVKTGTVKVESGKNISLLTPGEKVLAEHGIISAIESNNANYLAWKTGEFVFNNTPLSEVVHDLNTYYKSKFVCSIKSPCSITAKFSKENQLKDIEEIITTICDLKIIHHNSQTVFEER